MKLKIAVIFILIFSLSGIFIVNDEIEAKHNVIKMPDKISVKKFNEIKLSEMLGTVEKHKELKVEEIKYDNKDAYINVLVNGNMQSINEIANSLRQEKILIKINQITIVKNPQDEGAKMQLVFKRYR
ncbi:hypothetical protein ACJDT4_14225 [Clostridium neuense]|uniref:Uncharacterized protein n=1 Tax=Clostridium neuense TaxID=1728934 RepID=A0ABW8TGI7_9CLOT